MNNKKIGILFILVISMAFILYTNGDTNTIQEEVNDLSSVLADVKALNTTTGTATEVERLKKELQTIQNQYKEMKSKNETIGTDQSEKIDEVRLEALIKVQEKMMEESKELRNKIKMIDKNK